MKAAGWEKILKASSTLDATQAAMEQANEMILGLLRRQAPDLYKQHLSGLFGLKRGQPIVPGMGGGGHELMGTTPMIPDAPEKLSPEQSAAMGTAMEAWTKRTLIRQGVLPPEGMTPLPGAGVPVDRRTVIGSAVPHPVAGGLSPAAEPVPEWQRESLDKRLGKMSPRRARLGRPRQGSRQKTSRSRRKAGRSRRRDGHGSRANRTQLRQIGESNLNTKPNTLEAGP